MSKKYRLIQIISSPMGIADIGTESVEEGEYYCFPYKGKNVEDGIGMWKRSFRIAKEAIEDYNEWVEEVITTPETKQEIERVEVREFAETDYGGQYVVRLKNQSHAIQKDKFPAIKAAIEEVLNPEPPNSRGWEIVEMWNGRGLWIRELKGHETSWEKQLQDKSLRISKVRRLSDGEVFGIGDYVGYDNGNTRTKQDWAIDNFFIRESDNVLLARSKDNINVEVVDKWLYKNTPPPPQQSTKEAAYLFTTEDGVKISDELTTVYATTGLFKIYAMKAKFVQFNADIKIHSTEEKAKEYILLNKPCLSVEDIRGYIERYFDSPGGINVNQIIAIAQSKTNTP